MAFIPIANALPVTASVINSQTRGDLVVFTIQLGSGEFRCIAARHNGDGSLTWGPTSGLTAGGLSSEEQLVAFPYDNIIVASAGSDRNSTYRINPDLSFTFIATLTDAQFGGNTWPLLNHSGKWLSWYDLPTFAGDPARHRRVEIPSNGIYPGVLTDFWSTSSFPTSAALRPHPASSSVWLDTTASGNNFVVINVAGGQISTGSVSGITGGYFNTVGFRPPRHNHELFDGSLWFYETSANTYVTAITASTNLSGVTTLTLAGSAAYPSFMVADAIWTNDGKAVVQEYVGSGATSHYDAFGTSTAYVEPAGYGRYAQGFLGGWINCASTAITVWIPEPSHVGQLYVNMSDVENVPNWVSVCPTGAGSTVVEQRNPFNVALADTISAIDNMPPRHDVPAAMLGSGSLADNNDTTGYRLTTSTDEVGLVCCDFFVDPSLNPTWMAPFIRFKNLDTTGAVDSPSPIITFMAADNTSGVADALVNLPNEIAASDFTTPTTYGVSDNYTSVTYGIPVGSSPGYADRWWNLIDDYPSLHIALTGIGLRMSTFVLSVQTASEPFMDLYEVWLMVANQNLDVIGYFNIGDPTTPNWKQIHNTGAGWEPTWVNLSTSATPEWWRTCSHDTP